MPSLHMGGCRLFSRGGGGEWPKNCSTPINGSRRGDTFWFLPALNFKNTKKRIFLFKKSQFYALFLAIIFLKIPDFRL